jgi:cytochrome c oxidase assembly protein subunit 11
VSVTGRNPQNGARWTAIACAGVVAGMTGLAFASVPLYSLFCKATGFDGTPRVGAAPTEAHDRASKPLRVRFDTNVAPNLTWRFQPEVTSVDAVPGETKTVFFKVTNTGTKPATGIAAFNVQPDLMGSYFVKVECFCFTEHTLQPGESADYPLVFYVDQGLRKDADIGDLSEMTLSYTYFVSRNGSPVAANEGKAAGAGTRTNF